MLIDETAWVAQDIAQPTPRMNLTGVDGKHTPAEATVIIGKRVCAWPLHTD